MLSRVLVVVLLSNPPAEVARLDRHGAAEALATGAARADRALGHLRSRGRPGLWALTAALRRHPEPEARARLLRAVGALAEVDPRGAAHVLRRGLTHRSPEVRATAARALAEARLPAGTSILLAHAADPDPEVRDALAEALAAQGALRTTLERRRHRRSPAARATLLSALARLAPRSERSARIVAMLSDPAPEVRRSGLSMAAAHPAPPLAEPLSRLARAGAPSEAPLAARALGAIPGQAGRMLELAAKPGVPVAVQREAIACIRASRLHGLDVVLPALLALPAARRAPLENAILSDVRSEEIRDLVRLLGHHEPAAGKLAASWLSRLGPRATEIAATMLHDARPRSAETIRAFLASARPGGVTGDMMVRAQRRGPTKDRVRAIDAIGVLGSEATRRELLPLLDVPSPRVQAAAIRAAGDLEEATGRLLILARAPAARVREAAVTALASHPHAASRAARQTALADPSEKVRLAAIRSFDGTRSVDALRALELRAVAGTPRERAAAVDAIEASPSERAVRILVGLATHPDPTVRTVVLRRVDQLRE
jgi:HEAT repeat protein